jgi:hypothetical protein
MKVKNHKNEPLLLNLDLIEGFSIATGAYNPNYAGLGEVYMTGGDHIVLSKESTAKVQECLNALTIQDEDEE